MPTNAEVAAKLLRDAAGFFRNIGEQNEPLSDQMNENADVFEQVAALVEVEPDGELEISEEAMGEGGAEPAEATADAPADAPAEEE